MRFFYNLLKFLLLLLILALVGIAIYTLFFDPETEAVEVTKEIQLSQ